MTITPEAGTVKDKEARGVVPHSHLIELGFTDFVERSSAGYLFLSAASGDDIRGAWRGVKNRLVVFAREAVTDRRVAPNHGWRHLFKTTGREVGIEDSVLDGICGHARLRSAGATVVSRLRRRCGRSVCFQGSTLSLSRNEERHESDYRGTHARVAPHRMLARHQRDYRRGHVGPENCLRIGPG